MSNYPNTKRPSYIRERKKRRIRRILLLIIAIAIVVLVKYHIDNKKDPKNSNETLPTIDTTDTTTNNTPDTNNTDSNNDTPDTNNTDSNTVATNETTNDIVTNNDTDDENTSDNELESTIVDGYDFAKPVPSSDAVEESYFDDAIFIGNSRTEGVMLYSHPSNSVAYTHKGLMVNTIFTKPYIKQDDNTKITVMEAIEKAEFSKIYIMLGINETGWVSTDMFIEDYEKIIDAVKESHPDALIYIQSILPVTAKLSSTHSYVKNPKINEYNTRIAKMAQEKQVYYINVAESVMNEDGCLFDDAAVDGIHLKKQYSDMWVEYLRTHTIEKK